MLFYFFLSTCLLLTKVSNIYSINLIEQMLGFGRNAARLSNLFKQVPQGYNSKCDQLSRTKMMSTATTEMNEEVLLETRGNKGLITLNRPKALNALNLDMIRKITPALKKWQDEKKVLIVRCNQIRSFIIY